MMNKNTNLLIFKHEILRWTVK